MGTTTYMGETRLAVGGMAEVKVAVEWTAAGVPALVVLKRLLPHLADDSQVVDDFLHEARMMAALRHPNIVDVRDLGRDDVGFYIVQEYLSGADLGAVLREIRDREMTVPMPIACRVAAEVAAALQYSHCAVDPEGRPMHLVHRDINPSNVILTFDGRVKLIDFGIAKSTLRLRTTKPGAVKGQLAHVAPETLSGDPVDHRADVFSLGVVLHEMLTGRSLFQREHPAATIDAILNRPIASPRELHPQVPEALDAIVMRAIDREPGRRFSSAGEMRQALEETLRPTNAPVGRRQLASWTHTTMADVRRVRINVERSARMKAGVRDAPTPRPGVSGVSGVSSVKPPPRAARPREPNHLSAVWVASLIALLLLLLVIAAFLVGRFAAGGPGTAGA